MMMIIKMSDSVCHKQTASRTWYNVHEW